jgi:hypothetical protein
MEKNNVIIKGSFKGISADFSKNIVVLICIFILYLISNNIRKTYYSKYGISSFIDFVTGFEHISVIAIISSIFLLFFILAIIGISTFYKTIILLYETQRTITIDFTAGKILVESYSFPFIKNTDENLFNDIISININQGLLNRTFNTGDIYIEYLTCSKVDSQLRTLEMPYVSMPFKVKTKLI